MQRKRTKKQIIDSAKLDLVQIGPNLMLLLGMSYITLHNKMGLTSIPSTVLTNTISQHDRLH